MKSKTKLWVRSLSLVLAILTLGAAFCACDNGEDPVETEPTVSGVEEPTETVDVLEGVSYNGETLYMLAWDPSNLDERIETFSTDLGIVEKDTYTRMENTKKQLNINVDWTEIPGNGANMTSYVTEAVNGNLSGSYDLFCCYSACAATLTANGAAKNLLSFKTMDFTKPWWPANLYADCIINNKLYFCTGDISTNLVYMTSLVFFNKDLMEEFKINETIANEYGEQDIYSLVREGKWTHEALITLCKGVFAEKDGIQGATDDDLYGFNTYGTLTPNFYYGAGFHVIESTDNGLELSEDYLNTDIVTSILGDIGNFIHSSGYAYYGAGDYRAPRDRFAKGLAVFSLAPASHAWGKHNTVSGLEYGAIPVPKYNVSQEKYLSVHSIPYSMYVVASAAAYPEIAGSFLQCLGKWSYETTKLSIYETTMKGRYADGQDDVEMWELIIDSQTFDMGRVFQTQFEHKSSSGNATHVNTNLFAQRLNSAKYDDWASLMAKYDDEIKGQLTEVNALLNRLPD